MIMGVLACSPAPSPTPTPLPTPTQRPSVPQNDNVEALNSAQAALAEVEFGLSPLLMEE